MKSVCNPGIKKKILLGIFILAVKLCLYSFGFFPLSAADRENDFRLTLCGVVVSEDKKSSIAVFQKEKSGEVYVVKTSEDVDGYKLVQIFNNRVILQKNNQKIQVFLFNKNPEKMPRIGLKETKVGNKNPSGEDFYEKVSRGRMIRKTYIRDEVEKRINREWELLASELKYSPNVVEGVARGIKITRLPGGSFLSEIGIHKNDIIRMVNQAAVNDSVSFQSLYTMFRHSNVVSICLERKGALLTIYCEIVESLPPEIFEGFSP